MNPGTALKVIVNPRNALRCILFAAVPASVFYVISFAGLYAAGFGAMEILRDPAQQSGQSSFIGFVSSIGIWLWVSAFAICIFAAATNRFVATEGKRELLVMIGLLSIVLAVDDFFLIHDRYVNQNICYAAYAILAGALLFRHFRIIVSIDAFAFLLAGSMLALSILSDLVQNVIPVRYEYIQAVEEGLKFVGAAVWLYFGIRVATSRNQATLGADQTAVPA